MITHASTRFLNLTPDEAEHQSVLDEALIDPHRAQFIDAFAAAITAPTPAIALLPTDGLTEQPVLLTGALDQQRIRARIHAALGQSGIRALLGGGWVEFENNVAWMVV